MNEKDIDRIADKILEKIRNDKEIKAENETLAWNVNRNTASPTESAV